MFQTELEQNVSSQPGGFVLPAAALRQAIERRANAAPMFGPNGWSEPVRERRGLPIERPVSVHRKFDAA